MYGDITGMPQKCFKLRTLTNDSKWGN